ncbi:hypothetical protein FS749_011332 [Ceratobasidium sp. UAMH 11750]|nr:hypothetical protein FS749_011332 [Ceratobasidium sp. UAMH 11750]
MSYTYQASVSPLPVEILALTLGYLENISAISLVSRPFRRAALPLVYHTLQFSRTERINEFIDLVHTEGSSSSPQISPFLRCLIFHRDLNSGGSVVPLDKELVSRLRIIIPKLINLEHLTWNVWGYANYAGLFTDFRHWCPKFRSLDIDAESREEEATDVQVITCSPSLIYITT